MISSISTIMSFRIKALVIRDMRLHPYASQHVSISLSICWQHIWISVSSVTIGDDGGRGQEEGEGVQTFLRRFI